MNKTHNTEIYLFQYIKKIIISVTVYCGFIVCICSLRLFHLSLKKKQDFDG